VAIDFKLGHLQRGDDPGDHAGFLLHLANCGLLALFPRLDMTFRQDPFVLATFWPNEQIFHFFVGQTVDDAAGVCW